MSLNLLSKLNRFLSKEDAVHWHMGVDKPHYVKQSHYGLRRYGGEIEDFHKNGIPHLHPEDVELIKYIKTKLATSGHNKYYWKHHGQFLLSNIKSWVDQIDKFGSGPGKMESPMQFSYSLGKFEDCTGISTKNVRRELYLGKRQLFHGNNPEAQMHYNNAHNLLKELLDKSFGEIGNISG